MASLSPDPACRLMHRTMLFLLCAIAMSLAACGTPPADETAEAVERLYSIKQDGAWGYINKHGEVVIAPRFDMAWTFSEGLALVGVEDRYGYIDAGGTMVIEARFEDAWYFSDGLAPVQLDGEWGFIDRTGALAVDPQFDLDPDLLEEDDYEPREFGLVKRGDRYGFMNEQGQVVIDPRYDQAWYFADGMARVRIDGKWGFIDREGATAIAPQFDLAWDFSDGLG